MERHVEGPVEVLVVLEEVVVLKPGNEDQVAGGGDRQELGEPLDDPEQKGLELGHWRGMLVRDPAGRASRFGQRAVGYRVCPVSTARLVRLVAAHRRDAGARAGARSSAMAADGVGLWGRTDDKVITFFAFAVMAFFAVLVTVLSLIQIRLESRKERLRRSWSGSAPPSLLGCGPAGQAEAQPADVHATSSLVSA